MTSTPDPTMPVVAAPPCEVTGAEVASLLRAYRFRWACEDDLQRAVHAVLVGQGLPAVREVRLSARDRIDVLVGTVGVEIKVAKPGSVAPITKVVSQLQRYATSDQIRELVFVTTTYRHRAMPPVVHGVPVTTVIIGGLG